jgi:hypothetical protein
MMLSKALDVSCSAFERARNRPRLTARRSAIQSTFLLTCACLMVACDGGNTVSVNIPEPPPTSSPTPTTIAFGPVASSLTVGGKLQVTATVLDGNGVAMPSQQINWSTSDSTIASVSTLGLVTGISVGNVTINASSAGLNAQIQFAVFARTIVSGATVFYDDFDIGNYISGVVGGRWVGGGSGNVLVAPGGAAGSPFALTMVHRGKGAGLMSTAEQRFRLSQGSSELWLEYDFRVPDNFFHREPTENSNNKFLALWEENYNAYSADGTTPTPLLIFEFRPMNDSPTRAGEVGSSYVYLHGTDRTGKMHGGIGNKWLSAFGSWNRGTWLQIRVHVKLASADSANDGLVEMFADGRLVLSVYDFPLHAAATGRHFRNGYFLGWSNSGYDTDTEFKIDNVKFYESNPGWVSN